MKLVTWWGWAASRLNRTWEALSLGVEGHEDAGAESVFLGGGGNAPWQQQTAVIGCPYPVG